MAKTKYKISIRYHNDIYCIEIISGMMEPDFQTVIAVLHSPALSPHLTGKKARAEDQGPSENQARNDEVESVAAKMQGF